MIGILTNGIPAGGRLPGSTARYPSRRIVSAFASAALLAAMTAFPSLVGAVPFALTNILDDPTPHVSSFQFIPDRFGTSVGISGNIAIVGAPNDNSPPIGGALTGTGETHIFNVTTGALLHSLSGDLDAATFGEFAQFGKSVAIDGNRAVIGEPGADTRGFFTNADTGRAYLFNAQTGDLLRTFENPVGAANDDFGEKVAIDGNNVLIAATGAAGGGIAHVFDADTGDLLQTFDNPSPSSSDQFGTALGIDGDKVVIGNLSDDTAASNAGQAYIFSIATGDLLQTLNDPAPTGTDFFGISVAIDGGKVVVGSSLNDTNGANVGRAYLFDADTAALLNVFDDPTPSSLDSFGNSVAIDGANVLIGAKQHRQGGTRRGEAHLFDAISGDLLQTFDNPSGFTFTPGQFGGAVDIDGNALIVGDVEIQRGVGQAHIFASGPVAPSSSVPEPGMIPLLLSGFVGLGLMVRRKRKAT